MPEIMQDSAVEHKSLSWNALYLCIARRESAKHAHTYQRGSMVTSQTLVKITLATQALVYHISKLSIRNNECVNKAKIRINSSINQELCGQTDSFTPVGNISASPDYKNDICSTSNSCFSATATKTWASPEAILSAGQPRRNSEQSTQLTRKARHDTNK